ncbi:hypothetical protein DL96DRAFT_264672 [Flagelloscypha sp. PMI_526]|nr:hypothetical protein DL96DRAFT_264672 [Flagelloscypha sp. PMI_526]
MRPLIRRGMACILCRRRKLRCDGMRPSCNQCVRNPGQSPCEYEAGLRPNHQKMLEDKIAALEAQVFDLEQRNLSTASNQSNVLFSPAHPSFPSSSSSFPSPFVQRLPYKEVNVEQELSDDVALSLLASFLLHASELGFFLNASEFSRSAMLPRTSEGHSRPTLALLYAVYLWGQHFLNSMDHSRIRALESQALQHGALDFAGSSHPHRVMHGIQANVLLSNYYLQDHRLSLAAYFAMGSASLVTSAGLDDQTRSNLPPPHNFTEARERTDAFWIVFSLTRILAIITRRTMPALVPLLEVFGTNATLPWPSPATIGSQNTSAPSLTPSHQHPVVSMFLQGREPVDAGIISILVVGVKAAAVLNEVTSLISRWVSKTIEFEAFRASYQCFSKILQDLKNYMPRLLQHDPTHVSPAKLLLLGSMIETAVIVLSQLFASSERACRVTCMGAAASVLNPGDIEVAKLLYVHPIMGACFLSHSKHRRKSDLFYPQPLWSTSIRALQDECVRLDHSPPLAESLSRDHLQRYIARGISFLRQHAKHNPPLQQFDSRSRSSSRGPPLSASPASQSPQSLSVSPSGLSPSSLSSDMYSTQPRSQPPSPTSWDFIDSERSISSFHSDIIPW